MMNKTIEFQILFFSQNKRSHSHCKRGEKKEMKTDKRHRTEEEEEKNSINKIKFFVFFSSLFSG